MGSVAEIQSVIEHVTELRDFASGDFSQESVYFRYRTPMVITCESWIPQDRYIFCRVNPSAITITQGFRGAEQKTRTGMVFNLWYDPKRKSFFDNPEVTFQFQTGSLIPIRVKLQGTGLETGESAEQYQVLTPGASASDAFFGGDVKMEPVVPKGLDNMYEFLALLDEDKVLPNGRPNFVYVLYSTSNFPSISLVGFFKPDPIQILETADDPHQVTFQHTFTVRYSTPERLSNSTELMRLFEEAGFPATGLGVLEGAEGAEQPSGFKEKINELTGGFVTIT